MNELSPDQIAEYRERRLKEIGRAEDEVGHMAIHFQVEIIAVSGEVRSEADE